MKVSFIMPVYNAGKFLDRSIKSVLNLNSIDFELIIVDDGSKDNSWEIIKSYISKSKKVRGISIKNQGVSNARNTGINLSKGDVIVFIDADDYFNSGANDVLKNVLDNYKDDTLYFFNHNHFFDNGEIKEYVYPMVTNTDTKSDIINLFITTQSMNNCWCKIFNTKVIKDNNIYFDLTMKVGEDACFVINYLMCVEQLQYIDKPIYNYYINFCGAMKSAKINTILDEVKVYKTRKALIEKWNLSVNNEQLRMLHNGYFKKFLHYSKRHKCKVKFWENYKNVKKYYSDIDVKSILKYCSKQGLSKKQGIMLQIIKHRCYFLFSILCLM